MSQLEQGILTELARAVAEAPVEDLPRLTGALEEARVWSRLAAPQPNGHGQERADENLCAQQAAQRLGMSCDWLYKNAKRLPFAVRIGRRLVFSARGLERWSRQRMERMALPRELWRAVRIRAIQEGADAQDLVARALEAYLKGGRK